MISAVTNSFIMSLFSLFLSIDIIIIIIITIAIITIKRADIANINFVLLDIFSPFFD